jgi:tRNA pseudouridine38-40 synthase
MYRLALGIEYSGTNYHGWQQQLHHPEILSVQAAIERALSQIAAQPVTTICAGRTDTGVHACGQVVHCDVTAERSDYAWVAGCNANLPRDIRVLWAQRTPANFDARRSAIQRRYKYVLYNSRIRPGLFHDYVSWHYSPLNAELMHEAAQYWLGVNDFSSFRGAGCQSLSPVRELISIAVRRSGELIIFDIIANAFLYHMVRNMVGTLLEIGMARQPVEWSRTVLLAKDRTKASVTAPPHGLYLAGVSYPVEMQIPEAISGLWFFNQG